MYNHADQFGKNLLRDALSLASKAETEVEVLAATQRIDVYCTPDPAREVERARLGWLGELSAAPSLFEPFRNTPSLARVRRCLNKQLTWHHELERRARGSQNASADDEASPEPALAFPTLVVIGPGRPETALDAYGCTPVAGRPGLYRAVWGVAMWVVVLAELPRTRETLMLRLLASGRVLRQALEDLAALPRDAWERSIVTPLLIHFRLEPGPRASTNDEEEDVNAEIQAWWDDYQQQLRRDQQEARKQGERTGLVRLLLRMLRVRFGELPAATVARVEAADTPQIERWADRVLTAKTLAEVLDEMS